MSRAVVFSRLYFIHFLVTSFLDASLLLGARRWIVRRLGPCDCECKGLSLLPSIGVNLAVSGYVGLQVVMACHLDGARGIECAEGGAGEPLSRPDPRFWPMFAHLLPYTTLLACIADARVFTYYRGTRVAPVLYLALVRGAIMNVANACVVLLYTQNSHLRVA